MLDHRRYKIFSFLSTSHKGAAGNTWYGMLSLLSQGILLISQTDVFGIIKKIPYRTGSR